MKITFWRIKHWECLLTAFIDSPLLEIIYSSLIIFFPKTEIEVQNGKKKKKKKRKQWRVQNPEFAPLLRRKQFGGLLLRWVVAISVAAALCAVGTAAVSGSSTEHSAVQKAKQREAWARRAGRAAAEHRRAGAGALSAFLLWVRAADTCSPSRGSHPALSPTALLQRSLTGCLLTKGREAAKPCGVPLSSHDPPRCLTTHLFKHPHPSTPLLSSSSLRTLSPSALLEAFGVLKPIQTSQISQRSEHGIPPFSLDHGMSMHHNPRTTGCPWTMGCPEDPPTPHSSPPVPTVRGTAAHHQSGVSHAATSSHNCPTNNEHNCCSFTPKTNEYRWCCSAIKGAQRAAALGTVAVAAGCLFRAWPFLLWFAA